MPRRRKLGGIVFLVVWIVFWIAAIFVALYAFGAEALAGELAPAIFLAVWVAAALLALSRAARTLLGRIAGEAGPARLRSRRHRWDDGIADPAPPDGDPEPPPPSPPEAKARRWTDMPQVPGRRPRDDDDTPPGAA